MNVYFVQFLRVPGEGMIKIDPSERVQTPVCPENVHQSAKAEKNNTFGVILEKCIATANRIDEREKKAPEIDGLSPTGAKNFQAGKDIATIERAERMLDALNEYQRKLASPDVTMRDISYLINQIQKQSDLLTPALETLSEGNALKNILNEILIISSVEIIKFNRGDYVNPKP